MMNKPLLSLCIPTNGIADLVFPVLDSIFSQGMEEDLFEVVVMDNGDNSSFKTQIKDYSKQHNNLIYCETESKGFLNEIDAYRASSGHFIKFVNHRTKLLPGSLKIFIDFVTNNIDEKPIIYFSNGVLKHKDIIDCITFDGYVNNLSYFSSWSTGMGFWREDFDRLTDYNSFNVLFPHTNILFLVTDREKYIIDDRELLYEIPVSSKNKGKYDLFYAFGVEYPSIILGLYRCNHISIKTFRRVLKDNGKFIASLYFDFVICKKECSYDLSSFKTNIRIFYNIHHIKAYSFVIVLKKIIRKLLRR